MTALDKALHGPSALPIIVKPDGTFETAAYPPDTLAGYAPETVDLDWSGDWDMPDVYEEHERAALDGIEGGWRALTGWADDGSLFIFRSDRQHFGSDLEERILEEPGLWALVSVEMQPPTCGAGDDGMPCQGWSERERCDHADYDPESKAAGWALLHRNRPVKLGDPLNQGRNSHLPTWPVIRDGVDTQCWVQKTRTGYCMLIPGMLTESGEAHRGEIRDDREEARRDVEEWLTQHIA